MITAEFDYTKPTDIKQALADLATNLEDNKILAGGMSLVPMMNLGLIGPECLVSLNGIAELKQIVEERKNIKVGAMANHCSIVNNAALQEYAPLLSEAASLIGDVQVRNRGTIGGSLAHADPAANYMPTAFALEASIEVTGKKKRVVPMAEFYRGLMTTDMAEGEIITAIFVPKRKGNWGHCFLKFARVKGNFPIVASAALINGNGKEGRVAVGGASALPAVVQLPRFKSAEISDADKNEIKDAIRSAIVDPLEDSNGDAEYKLEMAAVYGLRAVETAWARAQK